MADDDEGAMVEGYYVRGSISATSHLQAVEVRVVPDVLSSTHDAKLLLDPAEALSLARNLVTAAEGALTRQLYDTKAGECATCSNERIVHVMKRGRTLATREQCPDCVPRVHRHPPVMASWAARMRAVLR